MTYPVTEPTASTNGNINENKCFRKYHLQIGELLDRLTILQLKEVKLPETKEQVTQEIEEIIHDINCIITNSRKQITAQFLRDLIILAQFNAHIWYNESEARKGNKDGNLLFLTHSINGIRVEARNRLQRLFDGRIEKKVDCLAAEYKEQWSPSGY
jgi:hypothetical protein